MWEAIYLYPAQHGKPYPRRASKLDLHPRCAAVLSFRNSAAFLGVPKLTIQLTSKRRNVTTVRKEASWFHTLHGRETLKRLATSLLYIILCVKFSDMKIVLFGGCYFPPTLPFEMSRFATARALDFLKFWHTSPSSIAMLLLHHELERRKDQPLSVMCQTMDGSVAERNVSTIALEKLQGTMLSQSCGTKNASKMKSNEAIPMCLV